MRVSKTRSGWRLRDMQETDLFLLFISRFDALNVRYIVTGSVAGMLYGEPRVTHDVDLVLELPRDRVSDFAAMFPIEEFYCPPEEVLVEEAQRARRGHFNLIHHESGFRADVYCANRDPFHEWALREARTIDVDGVQVALAPIEYVIVRKLEFFREGKSDKHLNDIRAMQRVSGELIRPATLDEWVARLQLEAERALL